MSSFLSNKKSPVNSLYQPCMQKMLMNVDVESFYEGDKLCLENIYY